MVPSASSSPEELNLLRSRILISLISHFHARTLPAQQL